MKYAKEKMFLELLPDYLVKSKKLKAFKRLENIKNTNGWTHVDAFQSDNIVF